MKTQSILGIDFSRENLENSIDFLKKNGGLLVAPAAPALVNLKDDAHYRDAIESSDLAITDSGLFVLCWALISFQWISRISGLRFLKKLIKECSFCEFGNSFWVMPTEVQMYENIKWLNEHTDLVVSKDNCYSAPMYSPLCVEDNELLRQIEKKKPHYIVINLGGGVQEKLGIFLKRNLTYSPAIICTGAALAFLSGDQVKISSWVDRLFLGWLFRVIHSPKKFVPRYLMALKLIPMIFKYKDKSPVCVKIH